jgi:hypothetical protein
MNQIYYLLEFHKKCCRISTYGDTIISNYCSFVNKLLNENFEYEEQKQLRMVNFNSELLCKFAFEDVDGITFDNLDEIKLSKLFDEICYVDIYTLENLQHF